MTSNGCGQIGERIELLHLASPHHRQEARHGEFARRALRAEHDLAPLHGGAQRAFDAVVVHEHEEMLVLGKHGGREVARVGIRAVEVALGEPEELLLQREYLRDQLRAGEGTAPAPRIAAKPMPQPEQPLLQGQRIAAETHAAAGAVARACALNRFQVKCAQQNCNSPV